MHTLIATQNLEWEPLLLGALNLLLLFINGNYTQEHAKHVPPAPAAADHKISIHYILRTISTYSNLKKILFRG